MANLSQILYTQNEYKTIMADISAGRLPMGILGLSPVHKAHFISALTLDCKEKTGSLVITADENQASKLCDDLRSFEMRAFVYPAKDINLRETQGQSREYEHRRLEVLGKMLSGDFDVITLSVEAAMQLTIPPEVLTSKTIEINISDTLEISRAVDSLLAAGYVRNAQVDGSGQFAQRGGILDFFPPHSEHPYRIEFWGDSIDSISSFDIETQRRVDALDSVRITPANEIICTNEKLLKILGEYSDTLSGKGSVKIRQNIFSDMEKIESGVRLSSVEKYMPLIYKKPATIFDYSENCLLFVSESFSVKERGEACEKLFSEEIKALFLEGVLFKGLDRYTNPFSSIKLMYERFGAIYIDNIARGSFDTPVKDLVNISARQLTPWNGSVSLLEDDLRSIVNKKNSICVVAAGTPKTAKALSIDLENDGFRTLYLEKNVNEFPTQTVCVIPGRFSAGINYPNAAFTLITYGTRALSQTKNQKKKKKGAGMTFNALEEMHRGDYIVHNLHGIGIFDGITNLEADGNLKDYIKIKYDKQDVLYVPVTQLDQVSKYIGPSSESGKVKLNRLGGKEWQKTRTRVRSALKDMAQELTQLYAKRMHLQGHAFSPDIDMQSDFERRFAFDETDDQIRCIDEIKGDMEKPHPMDRLLCGDVGFGKTEVALRAAFKCVADGKQCALLVPTTILALQHYQTITKRFDSFPIEARMLSRFVSPKEQTQTKKELKRGSVDILVGTHRIISKDIEFRDLGLIIIDEEQRFGVAQKEKLKEKYPTVDVLTLTATPIPRTLNMAMSGIRDMSILEEAPQDRQPIQTYVIEHDMEVIAQAISTELRRGGQVYYLHNRVETISRAAAKLHEALPDARIAIAHGQMSEEEISDVWKELLEGEIDILVCTTIIETGIDVPNVNTLIIENADKMGLAQLHQIRGRVGRSARRASAYFTFTRGKELSEIASQRLSAIREFTEFGSGFKIAMRDLEIRGAGNILGAQQHGHMEAVGYDLYLKMLSNAINEERGETPVIPEKECLIDLPIDAHIPASYIESVPHKLAIYRRIADIHSQADADDVIDELIDRFGDPPRSVQGLITVSMLRNTAIKHSVYEIGRKANTIKLYIEELNMDKIKLLARRFPGRITVSSIDKPHIAIKIDYKTDQLALLHQVFDIMDRAKES